MINTHDLKKLYKIKYHTIRDIITLIIRNNFKKFKVNNLFKNIMLKARNYHCKIFRKQLKRIKEGIKNQDQNLYIFVVIKICC